MRWFSSLCLLLLAACPPSLRRPESSQLVLTGSVYAGGFARRGEPLANATLTVRRADTGEELASNVTSSAGGYRLALTVAPKTRVVLVAEAEGFAPRARAFTAGPYTELTSSFSLEPLARLECLDTGCFASEAELSWLEPPAGASGSVASFDLELANPLEVDRAGEPRALVALGFARVSSVAGRLALRLPLRRWAELEDARPGTGAIEVETALFDPAQGTWASGPTVELRSEAGEVLPEADLAALRSLAHAGGAVAEVPTFNERFVAVLGAPLSRGCLTGRVTLEGKAAEGVTLMLPEGEAVATGADGAFCVTALTGATPLAGAAQFAGLPYSLGALARPAGLGACGGVCTALGDLGLQPDALRTPQLCRFSGRVVDSMGTPVANAEVTAFDDSVAGNALTAFCGATGTRCNLTRPSAADGTFSLNGPMLGGLLVAARVSGLSGTSEVQRRGGERLSVCPDGPVTVRLDRGEDRLEVSATFSGDTMTWLPPRAAARVTVLDAQGAARWELRSPSGLLPPLTWGVVPAGAVQTMAPLGAPASGDVVVVELDGMGRDGVVYLGVGTGTRP